MKEFNYKKEIEKAFSNHRIMIENQIKSYDDLNRADVHILKECKTRLFFAITSEVSRSTVFCKVECKSRQFRMKTFTFTKSETESVIEILRR